MLCCKRDLYLFIREMVYQEFHINWNVRTLEYLAVKVDESTHIDL